MKASMLLLDPFVNNNVLNVIYVFICHKSRQEQQKKIARERKKEKNYKLNVQYKHLNNNTDDKLKPTHVSPKHKPANAS